MLLSYLAPLSPQADVPILRVSKPGYRGSKSTCHQPLFHNAVMVVMTNVVMQDYSATPHCWNIISAHGMKETQHMEL